MRAEHHLTLDFKVIINSENEYSLWLADREVPPGWSEVMQVTGSSKECLAYIRQASYRRREPAAVSESYLSEEPPATAAYL